MIVDGRRGGICPGRVDGDVFCERSVASHQTLVAPPYAATWCGEFVVGAVHPAADFDDFAGKIAADDERGGKRPIVCTIANVSVDRIDRYGMNSHQDLIVAGNRSRQRGDFDHIRAAGTLDICCFHVAHALGRFAERGMFDTIRRPIELVSPAAVLCNAMYFWPFSSDSPQRNLACDEALLDVCEASEDADVEVLRIWSFPTPAVVLGRSSKIDVEVDPLECDRRKVPILRRCSGGSTVVGGPGCLMYSVVLSLQLRPQLEHIDAAHDLVMETNRQALAACGIAAQREGICDLTVDGLKVSGNALRVKRRHVLYHGTLLASSDLALIARLLGTPPRQPAYRSGRPHEEFIGNASVSPGAWTRAMRQAWDAWQDWSQCPVRPQIDPTIATLMEQRYTRADWHMLGKTALHRPASHL